MIFPLYGTWVWNRCRFSGTAYEAQVYTGPVNCFVICYAANKIKQKKNEIKNTFVDIYKQWADIITYQPLPVIEWGRTNKNNTWILYLIF